MKKAVVPSILIAVVLLALGMTAEARLPILRLNSGSSSCKEDDPIAARIDRPIWVEGFSPRRFVIRLPVMN